MTTASQFEDLPVAPRERDPREDAVLAMRGDKEPGYSPDKEEDLEISDPQKIAEAAESLAKEWIIKFFADRQMYCGGDIPEAVLLSPEYVNMVLYADIGVATDVAYVAMEIDHGEPFPIKMGGVSEDIQWVIRFLETCAAMRVPPCFCGGLLLIYLEQCEGVSIPNELRGMFRS